ncbi:MAG: hypothetical protein HYX67_11155 [Candidatus Melainabacteria bacterium]|nr:hypothetical protein [Candidatus Melainabacteria bacterium]
MIATETARIVGLCVGAAVVYGIIHDEITAHLCVEYFTVAHPHLFATQSPAALGVLWGITGTWWLGLLLGIVLARVSTVDSGAPKSTANFIAGRIGLIVVITAFSALVSGMAVYFIAAHSHLTLPDPNVSPEKHSMFYAVWAAHLASYFAAISTSLLVVLNVWSVRLRNCAFTKSEELAVIETTK